MIVKWYTTAVCLHFSLITHEIERLFINLRFILPLCELLIHNFCPFLMLGLLSCRALGTNCWLLLEILSVASQSSPDQLTLWCPLLNKFPVLIEVQ